jgi:hypothetical protein
MKTKLLAASLLLLIFSGACRKNNIGPDYATGRVSVRMTDAPTPYGFEEVNIDIRNVEVHIGGSTGGDWYRLQTHAGIYNVLQFCNGLDTLLADEDIPTGEIMAVRLDLGPNNSVRKSGTLYPLDIPAGGDGGLQFEIYEKIAPASPLHLVIDFDAGQSVIADGHGGYHLQPVIRAFTAAQTGNVHGGIDVPSMGVAFEFFDGVQHYTTYANPQTGQFLIRGLKPAVYTATVYTASGEIYLQNITVNANQTTEIGLVHVH